MEMNITSTTNVDATSYHATRKHDLHLKDINHSNKDIQFSKTHYNEEINVEDEQQVIRDLYAPEVDRYNKRQVETHHEERLVNSIDEYISKKSAKPGGRILTHFSNKDDWADLKQYITDNADESINDGMWPSPKYSEKLKTERRLMKATNEAFENYAKTFTERNDNKVIWVQGITNLDESSPHMHGQFYSNGHTKTGKLSPNITAGFAEEFGYDYNKVRKDPKEREKMMQEFRKQEDTAMVKCMQESLDRNFPEMAIDLNLYRTHAKETGKDMEELKQQAKDEAKLDKLRKVANRQRTEIMRKNQARSRMINKMKDDEEKAHQAELERKKAEKSRDSVLAETKRQQDKLVDKAQDRINRKYDMADENAKAQFDTTYATQVRKFENDKAKNNKDKKQNEKAAAQIEQDRINNDLNLREDYVNGIADVNPTATVSYQNGTDSDEIATENGHKAFMEQPTRTLKTFFKKSLDVAIRHVEDLIKQRQRVKEISKTKQIHKSYLQKHGRKTKDGGLEL